MTFFELIRSSLIMDSKRNRPPGTLMQVLVSVLQAKEEHIEEGSSKMPDPSCVSGRVDDE